MRPTFAALLLLLTPAGLAVAGNAPPDTFTIELEREETRTAVKVVPRADGTVAVTHLDGSVEYVAGGRGDRRGHDG